jgi:cell division inhibitor SepF
MAGAMRKMAVYLGLVEDDDRYDYDDYDDAVDHEARLGRRDESRNDRRDEIRGVSSSHDDDRGSVATMPLSRTAGVSMGQPVTERERESYRITTLHPRTYNEARTIGEHFREGTPVIMNLTEMDDTDAKRLVDFAAGLVFGLHGSIERVTQKVFLLSPANIDVTAEDKARIAEGGFFNQS